MPAPVAADMRAGEVLIRMLAGGICGSDLPPFRGWGLAATEADAPGTHADQVGRPLHEVASEVVAFGRVTGVDPVDRSAIADRFGIDDLVVCDSGRWAS